MCRKKSIIRNLVAAAGAVLMAILMILYSFTDMGISGTVWGMVWFACFGAVFSSF